MSGKLIIMAGMAVAFGATSYYAGNSYLENQTQARLNELENRRPVEQPVSVAKIVVAKTQLQFGQTLEASMLKEIDWPLNNKPEGSFSSIQEVVADGKRRAISSMEPGEPVLTVKLTGENGRAGLAGIIKDGMRAVTIPVDTVNGVGGFIQPGDRVDLILTRRDDRTDESTAKIMMENVKVLSVDQDAGSRSATAKIAQSVTLETNAAGAQKIALANNVGRISLLLRGAGDAASGNAKSLSSANMDGEEEGGFLSFLEPDKKTVSVRIVRGEDVREVTVPIEEQDKNQQ